MAAIDLSTAPLGTKYRLASLGTTWQEFVIAAGVRYTTQSYVNNHYVANASNGAPGSPETPEDGGAVGTHYMKVAAGSPYTERAPVKYPQAQTVSIFVAAASAGTEFCLSLEEAEE